MYCLKCGKEVQDDQVFCEECLAGMEQEPIPISAPVVIPAQPIQKNPAFRRPVINPEEELKRLQKCNQNLILVLVLLFTLVLLLGVLLYDKQIWQAVDDLGRNYSVVESFTYKIGR